MQSDLNEHLGPNASKSEPAGATDLRPLRTFSVWERLLQKTSIFIIVFSLLGPFWYWPLTAFLIYVHPFTAGCMIGAGLWKYFAAYFQLKLVKTVELDPKHNYMFCPHPHGIASLSHTANFITESTGFAENFPGIQLYPLVLTSHFFTPFHRELALLAGMRASSKEAITNLLISAPGTSVLLIPGGADESLTSYPGTYDLVLKKRKGFIKLALQTGAHLVPILAFGETDLYDVTRQEPGSFMYRLQQWFLGQFGFGLPTFSGVGFFGGKGPFPKPLPVTTVVGAPIPVEQRTGPSDTPGFRAAVDELHARYCAALRALWDSHKDEYAKTRRKSMEFVA